MFSFNFLIIRILVITSLNCDIDIIGIHDSPIFYENGKLLEEKKSK